MTPSDINFHDVEAGKVDMAINRFEALAAIFSSKNLMARQFHLFNGVNQRQEHDTVRFRQLIYSAKHIYGYQKQVLAYRRWYEPERRPKIRLGR